MKHKNITAAILVLSAFAGLCACTPAIDNGLTRSPQEHISVPEASVSASETDAGVPDESSQPDTPAQAAPVTGFDESILNQANTMLASMSLEEKVGQMFLARCPEADAASEAAAYHLGGYVLFSRDFENKTQEQVIADIQSCQDAASVPMFIAVDEEGGTVNRVSLNPSSSYSVYSP